MLFLLLVLAGPLFLLPVVLFLFLFVAALVDYLRGGGPAATTTGSNEDPSSNPAEAPEDGAILPNTGVLEAE